MIIENAYSSVVKVQQLEFELVKSKEEIETFEKRQDEWSARSSQIMSKYNASLRREQQPRTDGYLPIEN